MQKASILPGKAWHTKITWVFKSIYPYPTSECSPQINESSTFKATQARHPLQELLVEHYIPNDVFLDSTQSLKIVTGQNGSGEWTRSCRRTISLHPCSITWPTLYRTGKSAYLKMVVIIQYMAQIGSFVPADTGTAFAQFLLECLTLTVRCSGDWTGHKNLYQNPEVKCLFTTSLYA